MNTRTRITACCVATMTIAALTLTIPALAQANTVDYPRTGPSLVLAALIGIGLGAYGAYLWSRLKGPRLFGIFTKRLDRIAGDMEVARRLQMTTDQLRLAQTQARLGFWEYELTTGRSIWTSEAYEIFGLATGSELNWSVYLNAIDPSDRDRVARNFESAIANERREYSIEYRVRHPALGHRTIIERGMVEYADDSRAVKLFGFLQDVTDLRLIESDLRESRERLELVLAGANLGSWDWNPITKKAHYDRRWAQMIGYEPHELQALNSTFEDRIHPEDRDRTFQAINAHLRGETEQYEAEFRLCAKDGSWRWIQSRGRVTQRAPDGSAIRMSGTHMDIAERKQAELKLRQNEEWLRLLTSSIRAVIWESDVDSDRYTYVSPQIETVTGYTPEQWVDGDIWRLRMHPDDKDRVLAEYADLLQSGLPRDLEYRFTIADGRTIWIRDLIGVATGRDGRLIARGLMIDISDAKNAAEALRESERRYQTAERVALLSHWTAKPHADPNRDDPWVMFSRTAAGILGTPESQLTISLDEYINRFVHEEDRQRVRAERDRAFAEKSTSSPIEYRIRRGDGTEAFILQHCRYEFGSDGRMVSGFGTIQDVTRQKLVEKAMLSARLEAEAANVAKTQFLANTSHELRTPLNAIIGFSDLMRNELLGPIGTPAYKQYSEDIHASGQHLLSIINDLLDLSRVESGQVELHEEEIDVDRLVVTCLRLVESKAKERGIALESRSPPLSPVILGDARQLRQALINLLANAVKFTPPGGSVQVETELSSRSFAISVIDTGIGMSKEETEQAIKPFVQIENWLARKYEGVGLGLSITKAYCELHEGALELSSQPGKGTRATIRLPASRIVPRRADAAMAV